MAVVEYMLNLENGLLTTPEFIKDRGYFKNSANTFVGWVDDDREYYVPDTIITLSKTDVKNRVLAIHAESPFRYSGDPDYSQMSNTAVAEMADSWYDEFVAKNSA